MDLTITGATVMDMGPVSGAAWVRLRLADALATSMSVPLAGATWSPAPPPLWPPQPGEVWRLTDKASQGHLDWFTHWEDADEHRIVMTNGFGDTLTAHEVLDLAVTADVLPELLTGLRVEAQRSPQAGPIASLYDEVADLYPVPLCAETSFSGSHAFVVDPGVLADPDWECCGQPASAEVHQIIGEQLGGAR